MPHALALVMLWPIYIGALICAAAAAFEAPGPWRVSGMIATAALLAGVVPFVYAMLVL